MREHAKTCNIQALVDRAYGSAPCSCGFEQYLAGMEMAAKLLGTWPCQNTDCTCQPNLIRAEIARLKGKS